MLQINGKTFMNLQEAVQWLLDNNALPFQSSANYVANTEIGMGTIVNPSPAKVRIGSLIFFADSKVSTVIGLTENGFICSDQYNDLVDDVVYVSNVALNASGHLIVTLSNGDTIDAGLIKQVSGFSINGSQHLIVSFNDGTSTDLGAIFNGNVNISGTLNATAVTGDSIIENMDMSQFVWTEEVNADVTLEKVYVSCVKNGNKVTFVFAYNVTPNTATTSIGLGKITIPNSMYSRLYESRVGAYNFLDNRKLSAFETYYSAQDILAYMQKDSGNKLVVVLRNTNVLTTNTTYYVRYEATFLLNNGI